jgi:hypothetical protein
MRCIGSLVSNMDVHTMDLYGMRANVLWAELEISGHPTQTRNFLGYRRSSV